MEVIYDPVAANDENYLEVVFDGPNNLELDAAETLNAPLRELRLREAICVTTESSIRNAIQRMKEARIGSVLVERAGRLAGIFTERDLLMKIAGEEIDLDRTPVKSVMTANPETLGLNDAISFAIKLMSDGGYRHVPVTDAQGRPLYVVSVRDLAAWLAECHPQRVINLPPVAGRVAGRRHGG